MSLFRFRSPRCKRLFPITNYKFSNKKLNNNCLSVSRLSNQIGLEAAVQLTVDLLTKAVKPVMVGGPKLRVAKACDAFVQLADACGYALAVMPSAKGLVPEDHPHFIGTYWGAVSTAFCTF